jgi:ESS family glutamate:Na+ symporter
MDDVTDAGISISGVYGKDERPLAGVQTVKSDSIDCLALHLAVIGVAVLQGYLVKRSFIALEGTSEFLQKLGFLAGFPLFPLCMLGSIITQKLMVW